MTPLIFPPEMVRPIATVGPELKSRTLPRVDSMIHHSFWRGRKVFITGHTGFKGSWLLLWLESARGQRNRVCSRSADAAKSFRAGQSRQLRSLNLCGHSRLPAA